MSETAPTRPRRWLYALNLLWTVPLAAGIGLLPVTFAWLRMCTTIPCWKYALDYEQIPTAAVLCGIAALLVFLAIQLVPWTRRAWPRLLVSVPAALVWGGYWLLTVTRVFEYGFPDLSG